MSLSDWDQRQLDIKSGEELDRAAERRAKANADTEPAGCHVIPRERDEAMRDYREAVEMLQSALLTLKSHANKPGFSERYLLERVDKARQALQIIAATAQFVGKQ